MLGISSCQGTEERGITVCCLKKGLVCMSGLAAGNNREELELHYNMVVRRWLEPDYGGVIRDTGNHNRSFRMAICLGSRSCPSRTFALRGVVTKPRGGNLPQQWRVLLQTSVPSPFIANANSHQGEWHEWSRWARRGALVRWARGITRHKRVFRHF